MSGFGLAYLRQEGAPVHPDDTMAEFSDAAYERQLRAYAERHREVGCCSRLEIAEKIKVELGLTC